ncbi:hypothetical protein ISG33_14590 [Glaciecola sp. MH2013]|uniref:hypothetical protein n=1 Tax=Glaciecola sp. MH2013 TaxID=2785524 RepID=UPI0018A070E3|nr:hypothetical protein [Glaciecola sp. MH2013]MBF7074631.1 hypothetical protein [Glaciecola sp. MH2013]
MKILTFLLSLTVVSTVNASESITFGDLYGEWLDDNAYRTLKPNDEFGISFKANGDAVIVGNKIAICPRDKMKDIDGVFHISCFENQEFEVIRLVVSGWKSKHKRVLFGFHYWLADTERISGDGDSNEPERYRIFAGMPTSLVWSSDGK